MRRRELDAREIINSRREAESRTNSLRQSSRRNRTVQSPSLRRARGETPPSKTHTREKVDESATSGRKDTVPLLRLATQSNQPVPEQAGSVSFNTPLSVSGKIKVPPIDHFAGDTDPEDHLAAYKAKMSVQTGCEATWCKFFPTTLKGLALSWYNNIPARSVTNFSVLEALFL